MGRRGARGVVWGEARARGVVVWGEGGSTGRSGGKGVVWGEAGARGGGSMGGRGGYYGGRGGKGLVWGDGGQGVSMGRSGGKGGGGVVWGEEGGKGGGSQRRVPTVHLKEWTGVEWGEREEGGVGGSERRDPTVSADVVGCVEVDRDGVLRCMKSPSQLKWGGVGVSGSRAMPGRGGVGGVSMCRERNVWRLPVKQRVAE